MNQWGQVNQVRPYCFSLIEVSQSWILAIEFSISEEVVMNTPCKKSCCAPFVRLQTGRREFKNALKFGLLGIGAWSALVFAGDCSQSADEKTKKNCLENAQAQRAQPQPQPQPPAAPHPWQPQPSDQPRPQQPQLQPQPQAPAPAQPRSPMPPPIPQAPSKNQPPAMAGGGGTATPGVEQPRPVTGTGTPLSASLFTGRQPLAQDRPPAPAVTAPPRAATASPAAIFAPRTPSPAPQPAAPIASPPTPAATVPPAAPRQPAAQPQFQPVAPITPNPFTNRQPASGATVPQGAPPANLVPLFKPGSDVRTTAHPGGTQTHFNTKTQMSVMTDAGGRVVEIKKPRLWAGNFRPDGRASLIELNRNDGSRLTVRHGGHDRRHIEVMRPDGVRIVNSGRRGFVERPYRPSYVVRTYVIGNRIETRVYRTSTYANMRFNHYVPATIHRPAFYRWAASPWPRPVTYAWVPLPVRRFYVGYVTQEPLYSSAALWITDFLLLADLQLAYESRVAANDGIPPPPDAVVPMPPQVKGMIAEEVRKQIEIEQSVAAFGPIAAIADNMPPSALDPAHRLFIVHTDLEVTFAANGATCALSPGDVVQKNSDVVGNDGKVAVTILSAKNPACPPSFQTAVDLATLQDMYNQFREHVVTGLRLLAENSGKDGLPLAPATEVRIVPEAQAQADVDAGELLAAQLEEADLAEQEVMPYPESAF